MDITTINKELSFFYEAYLNETRLVYPTEISSQISLPLFIKVNREYGSLHKRIMIVGQETKTWYRKLNDKHFTAKGITEFYEDFNFGEKQKHSPFWKFSRNLFGALNESKPITGLLYTNLSRFDFNGKKVPHEITEKDTLGYQLLKKEIEITQPDIVVFTTCHNRDKYIKKAFPEANFNELPNYSNKFLSRVTHKGLPFNTFRTYHPKYLNYQKDDTNDIPGIINGILDNIK